MLVDINIEQACEALVEGQLVIYPTESVYGLGGDARRESIHRAVAKLKNRLWGKPFILLVANMDQAKDWCAPDGCAWLDDHPQSLWGTTHVLPAGSHCPLWCQYQGEVALRISAHAMARALCERLGGPLISTSANISGQAPMSKGDDMPQSWLRSPELAGIVTGEPWGQAPTRIIHALSGRCMRD